MDEKKEFENNSASSQSIPPVIPNTIPQAPVEPVPDIVIPTLRTYKNDVSQTVNQDKITSAKILMAEQRRADTVKEQKKETSVKRPLNAIALVMGIILLVAGLGAIGYFGYSKVIKKNFAAVTVAPSFLFVFDNENLIDASKDPFQIREQVALAMQEVSDMGDETYTDFVFYRTDPNTKEAQRIPAGEFFAVYDIPLPTNIRRSISQDFVYGAYKTGGKVEPFLVVGLTDFENAYSSMFVWESVLALDVRELFPVLKDLFDLTKPRTIVTQVATTSATSTASSTPVTSTSTLPVATSTLPATTTVAATGTVVELTPEEEYERQNEQRQVINRAIRFLDVVLYNRDVRAVRDQNGTPFFYYSFIDRNKILFAQDPKVLNEIVRKIKEKSLVR